MSEFLKDDKSLREFLRSDIVREVVLKSEIDAFLHDIDKMSVEFLMSKAAGHTNDKNATGICKACPKCLVPYDRAYKHPAPFPAEFANEHYMIPLSLLSLPLLSFNAIKQKTTDSGSIPNVDSYLGEAARHHHAEISEWQTKKSSLLPYLLATKLSSCDGLDSSYDKASAQSQQCCEHTYLATPFGYEFWHFDTEKLDVLRESTKGFEKAIVSILQGEWHKGRDTLFDLAGRQLPEQAFSFFRLALGETQRGANDVLLFDHVFSVASMLKTMLLRVILESKICGENKEYFIPLDMKYLPSDNTVAHSSWNVYSVAFDVPVFLYRCRRIGEIKGFFNLWQDICENLRKKLEIELPVAAELYLDLHGIHFLIPRFSLPQMSDASEKLAQEFATVITGETRQIVDASAYFTCKTKIFEDEKDGLLQLGEAVQWSQTAFRYPLESEHIPTWMLNQRPSPNTQDLCTCCHVRPQNRWKFGYCDSCYELRQNRAHDWHQSGQNTTIWLNELSDANSQIALVSLKFDLSNWLNGEEIRSLRIDNEFDIANSADVPTQAKNLISKGGEFSGKLSAELEAAKQGKTVGESSAGKFLIYAKLYTKDLLEGFEKEHNLKNASVSILRQKILEQILQKYEWRTYVIGLATKHPSMARIRRVWSSTFLFFHEILEHLQTNGILQKQPRLKFQACLRDPMDASILQNNPSARIQIGSVFLDVYVHSLGRDKYEILSQGNLRKLFGDKDEKDTEKKDQKLLEKLQKAISANDFTLEVKTDDEDRGKTQTFVMGNAEGFERSEYTPCVDIVNTPQLFQFLCPAEHVDAILKFIYDKYTREMSKVRDRLPLHVNVVYFKNKYPLYVVLETAQNMLADEYLRSQDNKESWQVVGITEEKDNEFYDPQTGQKSQRKTQVRKLTLKSIPGRTFAWQVDTMTGDPDMPDLYYPNFEIEPKAQEGRVNFTEFVHPDTGKHYLNVQELREGDTIKVQPSTWDVVFIDSNEARFLVQGKKRRHAMLEEGRQAHYLDDMQTFQKVWDIFEKCPNYSQAQLEKLCSLLFQKHQEWRNEWAKPEDATVNYFIRSLLFHPNQLQKHFGKAGEQHQDYELLRHVCHTGMIFDIVDYYCKLCGKNLDKK